MAGRKLKYKPEQIAAALAETKGMVTLAARRVGCDVGTIYSYIERFPDVAAARSEAHEQFGDEVELVLRDEAINKRNTAILIFLAKTKFKDRGYIERQEHTGADGGPLDIVIKGYVNVSPEDL